MGIWYRSLIVSVICLVSYFVFYYSGKNTLAGFQAWYTACMIIPASVIVLSLCYIFKPPSWLCAIIVSLWIILNMSPKMEAKTKRIQASQIDAYNASQYFKTIDGMGASWNSGVLGYFCNGRIINLDGLVNDEIFPYIKNKTALDYIKMRKIDYIIDGYDFIHNAKKLDAVGINKDSLLLRLDSIKSFGKICLYKVKGR